MTSTQRTQLVTDYINANKQWRIARRECMRHEHCEHALGAELRAEDAMFLIAQQFTAAHWAELHARRS